MTYVASFLLANILPECWNEPKVGIKLLKLSMYGISNTAPCFLTVIHPYFILHSKCFF